MAKLRPRGFSQKRRSKAQPSRITVAQKRFGLVFIDASIIFQTAYSRRPSGDSQKVSQIHELGRCKALPEQDYKSIRIGFRLLTFKLKCAILPLLFGGQTIEPPSYRKEEVMSNMDSSNKPSAVASLLSK